MDTPSCLTAYRQMKMLQGNSMYGAKDKIQSIQSGYEHIQQDALNMRPAMEKDLYRMALASQQGAHDVGRTLQRSLSRLALDTLGVLTNPVEAPPLLPTQLEGGGEKFDMSFQNDCGLNKIVLNHCIYGIEVSDKGIAGGVTLHCQKDGHEEDDLSMTEGAKINDNSAEDEVKVTSGCVNLCLTPRRKDDDDLEEDAMAMHASRDTYCATEDGTTFFDAIEHAEHETNHRTFNSQPDEPGSSAPTACADALDALRKVHNKDSKKTVSFARSCKGGFAEEFPDVQPVDGIDPDVSVPAESTEALTLAREEGQGANNKDMMSNLNHEDDAQQEESNAKSGVIPPCLNPRKENLEENITSISVEECDIDPRASF